MLKFLERKPIVARTPDNVIKWVQLKKRAGETALIPYVMEAQPGWAITHSRHGKVRLLGTAGDGYLKVEKMIDGTVEQMVVNAADCGEPIYATVKVTSTEQEAVDAWLRCVWTPRVMENALVRVVGGGSTAAGKQPVPPPVSEEPPIPSTQPTKRPVGRPKGSKDKKQRVRTDPSRTRITWEY